MQPVPTSFTNIAQRLAALSQARASGELIFSSGAKAWHLYFFLGRLLYATGGVHRVRRWHRALKQDCPNLKFDAHDLKENELWEYHLLNQSINKNQISLTSAKSIIEKIVEEVLFSLVSHSDLKSLWLPKKLYPIALIEVNQSLCTAFDLYKQWRNMGLGTLCPDMTPILKQPTSEQNLKFSKILFSLRQLIDGENTIWDIALHTRQSVITAASLVQNLVYEGVLELLTIPDLPIPVGATISAPSSEKQTQPTYDIVGNTTQTPSSQSLPNPLTKTDFHQTPELMEASKDNTRPQSTFDSAKIKLIQPKETTSIVAYIDDSQSDNLIMSEILKLAGYKYVNIQDPVTALPILLECKPNLIFLDLVMPIANGYEICTQIRRVSAFKETPVIIVTSSDGIIDRVRSKIVGSSGFLAKPITKEKVLKVLQKYLLTPVPVQSTHLQTLQV
ncbi:response regulator [Brasilonema bromeliae]|uniref:Protein PatA n=1 Tax=Brasilonema bromeliae SPC951 TaxID=385972 RepID=A0ABX1PBF6_9CYAN|nr:response regulator [Brasilonema bromeliae]NMG20762.1 response regulator [Brasilonema bromeliae SPC951]